MLGLDSVLLFSENPARLTEFYTKILGGKTDWSGGDFAGFKAGNGYLIIGPHDKVKGKNETPERMMINFAAEDVKTEFNRIKGLGATVVAEPYQPKEEPSMWLATFADPDGNYFQLGSAMKK